jgi:hypothetical protein
MTIMPLGGNKMAKGRAAKTRQKLNLDQEKTTETKKKHPYEPLPVPWYGQKGDSKRVFDAGQNPE